jgi:hypothetical protein
MYDKCIEYICKKNNIQYERYSLLTLSFLFLLLDKNYYNDYIFICIISFSSSLVIFANFPDLVTWNSSKPIYYEDLYIDFEKLPEFPLTDKHKELYLLIYTRSLIVSSSILISVLTCYWKFKTENSSLVEIAGITGGLLQIATILNILSGRAILYCIKQFISIQICVSDSNNDSNIEKNDFSMQASFSTDNCDRNTIIDDDIENNIIDNGELTNIPLND